ncbi:response regulator transcription factor [Mucilaginibacter sp.]|uniref:response regulator transcription factor n=1 Tax=Mucilaginibacter sp. TaxID=1882438 RepID=UPI000CC3075F|nr:response regulator transcription factor [Mucilaginibacter sp.]PLW90714.1 MAG: DNA-binding response regulator [Mucilaginibacter sp.]PMP64827.1 MAG: DNA-binding response regulator [Mucilaginibacter sp.]HEK20272.1 response regulator transcription factor [Bacteroidota bacterium]
MNKIRIGIVDDYTIFRDGLRVSLASDGELEVVFEAGNGQETLDYLANTPTDVILMDLKMPVMDGMEATRKIRIEYPDCKIIAITLYDDEKFIIHLMELGASGYLLKNAESREIRKSIHAVYQDGYYFNDVVNKALLKRLVIKGKVKPSFNNEAELTDRELQVLKLICQENTAAEIGDKIYLSPRSVEGIRQRLIDKIGVRNTAGLVMYAVRKGIID